MADKVETKTYKPKSADKCNNCDAPQTQPTKAIGIVTVNGENANFRGFELPDTTGIAKFVLLGGIVLLVIVNFFQSSHQETRSSGYCNPPDMGVKRLK